MTGTTISHYQVREKLGSGGMGVVYRADDLRLRREVALKFLPDGLSGDREAIARFQREARAASALNHPHICTIYDVDEHEGRHFIAMELLEGESLAHRIQARRLSAEEVLRFGVQLADGLAAAHARQIVHRDVKPANVFITNRGDAKILDFGLAKPLRGDARDLDVTGAADLSLTGPGITVGTVAYMSPEQALGRNVDARSDVFSLGVVLYEMATGIRPFLGDTSAALFDEILHKVPDTGAHLDASMPAGLGPVIDRALEKDVAARYQRAIDLLAALRSLACEGVVETTAARLAVDPPRSRSVAVLAFADMSPARDQEHFCDGIAEELITSLARIRALRVAARTSAFFFKGKNADIREIGHTLGVDAVVEGSIRKAGDALRISVQLVNVADGRHLWTERYDRELKDVFAIQDEVTAAIIDHLKLTLVPEERLGVLRRRTDNLEAHNHYLKGLQYLWMDTSRGFTEAVRAFEQALEEDPDYAQAYWGLSTAHLQVAFWGGVPPSDACRKAKLYARRALSIDPSLGEAHGALGYVHLFYDWAWKAAERETLEAVRLSPNSSTVRAYYAFFLLNAGRLDEGVTEALKAQVLDPVSSFIAFTVGFAFALSRDLQRAIDVFQAGIRLNPGYYILHSWLGQTYFANGQYADAIVAHEKAVEISKRLPYFVSSLAMAYHQSGRTDEADALWRELEERARREFVPPICFVQMNALRGNIPAMLRSLMRAGEAHDSRLCWAGAVPAEFLQGPGDSRTKARLKHAILKTLCNRAMARHRIADAG